MAEPVGQSTSGVALVWAVIVGGILALASFISGWPWNYWF